MANNIGNSSFDRANALFTQVQKDTGSKEPTVSNNEVKNAIGKAQGQDKLDLQTLHDLFPKMDVDNNANKGGDNKINTGDLKNYFDKNRRDQPFNHNIVPVVEGVKLDTTGMNDKQINNVKGYITGFNNDEDGKKLIKGATQNGPITASYDPSYKDGMGAAFHYADQNLHMSKKLIDNEGGNDPTSIMGVQGFAHEFVHAATQTINDDSKLEESLASALGSKIAGRVYNQPVDSQKVFDNWIKPGGQTSGSSYKDLEFDNNIFEDLTKIGIDLKDFKKPLEPGK